MLRRLCEKLSLRLPARDIRHPTNDPNGRPYLRRYYLGTVFGIRFYLHHFVDSDPDGLHNHPWRFGGSIILAGWYRQERRYGIRRIRCINIVNGDTLHRVVVPTELRAITVKPLDGILKQYYQVTFPKLGVWTLFFHTKKVMPWAVLKNKGLYVQYYIEEPTFEVEDGHSQWYKTAPTGEQLFGKY